MGQENFRICIESWAKAHNQIPTDVIIDVEDNDKTEEEVAATGMVNLAIAGPMDKYVVPPDSSITFSKFQKIGVQTDWMRIQEYPSHIHIFKQIHIRI
jgi:redox-regulated HSP33 family molecular chaperone